MDAEVAQVLRVLPDLNVTRAQHVLKSLSNSVFQYPGLMIMSHKSNPTPVMICIVEASLDFQIN